MADWTDAPETAVRLQAALDRFDWRAAGDICDDLVGRLNGAPQPFPLDAAKEVLFHLRRKRLFSTMEVVADGFIRSGQIHAQILRQYAQAMIDQGNLTAPRLVLQSILTSELSPAPERAEAAGLIGRIDKQLYVNARGTAGTGHHRYLRNAITDYYGVYKDDPDRYLWQGINTVALLTLAESDRVQTDGFPAPQDIASRIAATLNDRERLEYWDRATAIENSVALGHDTDACNHLLHYTVDPRVDAFECNSLLRQLTEIWRLTPDEEPGATLIPVLKAVLLSKLGGRVELPAGGIREEARHVDAARARLQATAGATLQAVWGDDRFQPLAWYRAGLARCEAVARVESVTGQKIGTGFLVRSADFFSPTDVVTLAGGSPVLLLTNSHVIAPADQQSPRSIAVAAARANFEAAGQIYKAGQLVWSSPPHELDATFVTLQEIDSGCAVCPLEPAPKRFLGNDTQRVYVIGYPRGGGLSFSLQDSAWLDADESRLLYRTPTDDGSSGSPVFDQDYWTVIGLHHAERQSEKANEGIPLTAVLAKTRAAS